jgi:hypothetical protein
VLKMRDVSRHKSMDVLRAYVRDADLFRDHLVIKSKAGLDWRRQSLQQNDRTMTLGNLHATVALV